MNSKSDCGAGDGIQNRDNLLGKYNAPSAVLGEYSRFEKLNSYRVAFQALAEDSAQAVADGLGRTSHSATTSSLGQLAHEQGFRTRTPGARCKRRLSRNAGREYLGLSPKPSLLISTSACRCILPGV
jgi:hypothetical protein